MGEAADRKLREIAETRRRLEGDLRELEGRLPAPLRSVKGMVGAIAGSSVLSAVALRALRSNRKGKDRTEVVVRVVRDDEPTVGKGV